MVENGDEILTGQEARQFLKISRSTLWKLTRESKIPAYRVGNGKTSNLRYKKSELMAWLNSNRVSERILESRGIQ
ncbi:MAG: DNA-binding protein [Candidatus Abyssobacteria bacterium SURF_5]|uniref:DNA-binding protein n=1 Tax=Abyssobacteria bacterium (strain SURF_5) TaxID=2093360 RepID=A0A3A4NIT7_ABYX5|nr:MAG: DNA-binding protein [Candidatus Abyssubacteria bacterium SURF_5]